MKKARKGFSLIELLIVVAIMGSLAAMMASSSADSVDNAAASAIINNLQSMKTAAYSMYMQEPTVASISEAFTGEYRVDTNSTVGEKLGKYLGRPDIATGYGIVGNGDSWYVYYQLQDGDSAKVRAILDSKANAVGLLGVKVDGTIAVTTLTADDVTYYDADATDDSAQTHIALQVR